MVLWSLVYTVYTVYIHALYNLLYIAWWFECVPIQVSTESVYVRYINCGTVVNNVTISVWLITYSLKQCTFAVAAVAVAADFDLVFGSYLLLKIDYRATYS